MKIIIATPLYPPDTAEPAPYVKELAQRLSKDHTITIATYACLPEKIPGVTFVCTSKRISKLTRLIAYTRILIQTSWKADVLYVQNGASTELPAVISTLLTRTPLIFQISDERYKQRVETSFFLSLIEKCIITVARTVITQKEMPHPLPRPEILPFEPYPTERLAAYNASWDMHINQLQRLFNL